MANKLDALFFFGRPFGPIYGALMRFRQQLYTKQVFKQHKLSVPVISVGNLVLGGTGKTPTVIFLARFLSKQGYTVGIVSRGYRGSSNLAVNVVSDGTSKSLDPAKFGDEPVLMASSLEKVPVLTGKKRIFPCLHAIEQLGVDCIILDDGFQHMTVHRDINLVLFDATTLAGNSRIFPGGPLREPVAALERSTAFLITGQTEANKKRSNAFKELLETKFPSIPAYRSSYCSPALFSQNDQVDVPADLGPGFLFCAIANPERVQKSAVDIGIDVAATRYLQDHFRYNQQEIDNLCREAKEVGAKFIFTTAKDQVKLNKLHFSLPLYVLNIQQSPEPEFNQYILDQLKP